MSAFVHFPDKYLQKENGGIVGYEKLAVVYKKKGRARSMVEDMIDVWGGYMRHKLEVQLSGTASQWKYGECQRTEVQGQG